MYNYVDKLQTNKADKGDLSLEMNVKADKEALDSKVRSIRMIYSTINVIARPSVFILDPGFT